MDFWISTRFNPWISGSSMLHWTILSWLYGSLLFWLSTEAVWRFLPILTEQFEVVAKLRLASGSTSLKNLGMSVIMSSGKPTSPFFCKVDTQLVSGNLLVWTNLSTCTILDLDLLFLWISHKTFPKLFIIAYRVRPKACPSWEFYTIWVFLS